MDTEQVEREDLIEVARECFLDPVLFCKTFFTHLFPAEIPWVHRGLLAILTKQTAFLSKYGELEKIVSNFVFTSAEEEGKERPLFRLDEDGQVTMFNRPFLEIMLPRGFSKTTYTGIAVPCYKTVYQLINFGVYISEASEHATMQLDNVRRELAENERIIQVFGDLRPRLRDDEKWSAKMFETKTGVTFVARGRGAQVRGLNHKGYRPQEIIFDDVEDKESVETEGQRAKTRSWFYGDVIPALPTLGGGRLIGLGTMLHPQALLPTLAEDERWSVIKFGVKDKDGDWLWPAAIDEAKDEANKRSYTRAGELHVYYMEFHNEARSPETALFKREWFKYGPVPQDAKIVAAATYCDPAISEKESADDAVIITVLQDDKGTVYVTDAEGGKPNSGWGQDEITKEFFRQHKLRASKDYASFAGTEANAYQAALQVSMRQHMFRDGYYFELEAVTHQTKKWERIRGVLAPRFQNGFVTFTRKFPKLEAQLLDLRPKEDQEDDWADTLAGAVKLLDPVSGFYMAEPEYKDEDDDEEDPYNESHIPDIMKEVGGSWE